MYVYVRTHPLFTGCGLQVTVFWMNQFLYWHEILGRSGENARNHQCSWSILRIKRSAAVLWETHWVLLTTLTDGLKPKLHMKNKTGNRSPLLPLTRRLCFMTGFSCSPIYLHHLNQCTQYYLNARTTWYKNNTTSCPHNNKRKLTPKSSPHPSRSYVTSPGCPLHTQVRRSSHSLSRTGALTLAPPPQRFLSTPFPIL